MRVAIGALRRGWVGALLLCLAPATGLAQVTLGPGQLIADNRWDGETSYILCPGGKMLVTGGCVQVTDYTQGHWEIDKKRLGLQPQVFCGSDPVGPQVWWGTGANECPMWADHLIRPCTPIKDKTLRRAIRVPLDRIVLDGDVGDEDENGTTWTFVHLEPSKLPRQCDAAFVPKSMDDLELRPAGVSPPSPGWSGSIALAPPLLGTQPIRVEDLDARITLHGTAPAEVQLRLLLAPGQGPATLLVPDHDPGPRIEADGKRVETRAHQAPAGFGRPLSAWGYRAALLPAGTRRVELQWTESFGVQPDAISKGGLPIVLPVGGDPRWAAPPGRVKLVVVGFTNKGATDLLVHVTGEGNLPGAWQYGPEGLSFESAGAANRYLIVFHRRHHCVDGSGGRCPSVAQIGDPGLRAWERSLAHGRYDAPSLRLARNRIFAETGRTFEDPELRAYFEKLPWYRPRKAADQSRLGADERKALARIRRAEDDARRPPPAP